MAKLVGTGKDPLGRFPDGHIFDSPAGSPEYKDLIDSGAAVDAGPAPGHEGLKRDVEIANAVVRGDSLGSAEANERAEQFLPDEKGKTKVSAHDVVHSDGGISLGIIITRGASLQDSIRGLVRRFADDKNVDSHDDMERIGLNPTRRQIRDVMKRVTRNRNPISFRDAWTDQFVSDKFGMATTHWSKLQDRVQRGVGNPCPLVLIGLPSTIVTFGESQIEVQKLLDESND